MVTRKSDQPSETRQAMRGGEGEVCLTSVSVNVPPKLRLFSKIELPVGASIGYHVHEGETELFYFVSGEAELNDNGEVVRVNAGDSMATFSGQGHSVANVGSVPLMMIAVIVLDA